MGTCMSKIQQKPPNDYNPPPHDKLLIPQISIVHPHSELSSHPCVSSSSPSSTSSSSFTSNTTTTSFDTNTTSSCSTSSTSVHRQCMIKERHNIVILDPQNDNTKAKPVWSSARQPTAKRLRSRSPPATVTRRKSIRCEQSPAAPRSHQKQSIPSPKTNSRICPMEDIDNPLISMDCFIFIVDIKMSLLIFGTDFAFPLLKSFCMNLNHKPVMTTVASFSSPPAYIQCLRYQDKKHEKPENLAS